MLRKFCGCVWGGGGGVRTLFFCSLIISLIPLFLPFLPLSLIPHLGAPDSQSNYFPCFINLISFSLFFLSICSTGAKVALFHLLAAGWKQMSHLLSFFQLQDGSSCRTFFLTSSCKLETGLAPSLFLSAAGWKQGLHPPISSSCKMKHG